MELHSTIITPFLTHLMKVLKGLNLLKESTNHNLKIQLNPNRNIDEALI
ncbi:uncharacterized protein METZ01_LOCUS311026 [marine metagenome]|uniref:Uncharacterized protein n=1 Tax=marine metagenome TaxID=408172 RepID=A0A382NEM7_9ZZZZ